jgi:hypothetical protein
MNYGDVIVYTLGKCPPRMFMFAEEKAGGYYRAIARSGEVYLMTGSYIGNTYHKNICRRAEPEEIEQYLAIALNSKYTSKEILNILKTNYMTAEAVGKE